MFWVAAAVSVASSVMGAKKARKARKARRMANMYQKKQNILTQYQQTRQFMRQFRQAQAAQYANALQMGVDIESSAIQGTLASQSTQAMSANKELQQMTNWADTQARYLDQASKYDYQSQLAGVVGNFANQFMAGGPSSKPSTPEPPSGVPT